jgi:hypothetical protein
MDKDMATQTKTWQHGRGHGNMDKDMETWRHEDMETWRHGDIKNGHMKTWTRGDKEIWTW